MPAEVPRLAGLQDRFEAGVTSLPGVRVNAAGAPRLPNVSSVAFEGVDAPTLLIRLDLEGVAASAGSACAAGSTEPSHVLAALDLPHWAKTGTVRFSFGKLTSGQDVERIVEMLPEILRAVRESEPDVGTQHCGLDRLEERF